MCPYTYVWPKLKPQYAQLFKGDPQHASFVAQEAGQFRPVDKPTEFLNNFRFLQSQLNAGCDYKTFFMRLWMMFFSYYCREIKEGADVIAPEDLTGQNPAMTFWYAND